jgi:nucleotide-binding universal stress UspA family protein
MAGDFERILLPLDGTETAKQALPYATELAQKLDAEVILFRVVQDVEYVVGVKDSIPTFDPSFDKQQELVDHASRWLQRIVDELELHKIAAKAVVDVGNPGERILAYAAESNVDLIVMSTHGRRGVSRLLYGSVAALVLGDAPCPVMLVHPRPVLDIVQSQEALSASL